MLKGQIVASGETATVFAPPYHPYTELLLSSVPEMRSDWLDEVLSKARGGRCGDGGATAYAVDHPNAAII